MRFTPERARETLARHRGPFVFCVGRPHAKRPGFHTSEWLQGSIERDDVLSEAEALLSDPRDTITTVSVWSEREQQFVYTFYPANFKEAA